MSVACDLSELVCVRIIDDMIGSSFCFIDRVSAQLLTGFRVDVF